jgi:hypothetical protein
MKNFSKVERLALRLGTGVSVATLVACGGLAIAMTEARAGTVSLDFSSPDATIQGHQQNVSQTQINDNDTVSALLNGSAIVGPVNLNIAFESAGAAQGMNGIPGTNLTQVYDGTMTLSDTAGTILAANFDGTLSGMSGCSGACQITVGDTGSWSNFTSTVDPSLAAAFNSGTNQVFSMIFNDQGGVAISGFTFGSFTGNVLEADFSAMPLVTTVGTGDDGKMASGVPELNSWAYLLAGFACMGLVTFRRRQRRLASVME